MLHLARLMKHIGIGRGFHALLMWQKAMSLRTTLKTLGALNNNTILFSRKLRPSTRSNNLGILAR